MFCKHFVARSFKTRRRNSRDGRIYEILQAGSFAKRTVLSAPSNIKFISYYATLIRATHRNIKFDFAIAYFRRAAVYPPIKLPNKISRPPSYEARHLSYKCKIYALNFTATHRSAKGRRDIARSFRIVSCCEFFRRKTFCYRMRFCVLFLRAPACALSFALFKRSRP